MDDLTIQTTAEASHDVALVLKAIEYGKAGDLQKALATPVVNALAVMKSDAGALGLYLTLLAELVLSHRSIRKGDVEKSVAALMPPDETESCARVSAADEVVALVTDNCELFTDNDDDAYASFTQDGHRELWPLNSKVFRDWISQYTYHATGRTPRAASLADALSTLAGIATHEGQTEAVHLKAASDGNGGYYVDMGDERWRCIHITVTGWQMLNNSPVKFRRTKATRPIPTPTTGGTLGDLLILVNVDKKDALLLVTALIECLRPDTAYPVIELIGDHGAGKSTTAKNMRRLIDPRSVNLRSAPKSVEDLFVGARNNHIVCLNNLSRLTPDMQDGLCNLSTGGGYASRKLYTDDDEVTFETKRPAILNGINPTVTQADLTSRTVRVECPSLNGLQRRDDAELAAVFDKHAPAALGFILDTMCAALALIPSINLSDPPRLMDFAKLGEAVGQVLHGADGRQQFTERYTEAREAAALQALDAMPVIVSLIDYLEKYAPYTGNYQSLLSAIEERIGKTVDAAWPKSGRGLSDAIGRARPTLDLLGWTVTDGGRQKTGRMVTIQKKTCFGENKFTEYTEHHEHHEHLQR